MKIDLMYGQEGLLLELPDHLDVTVIRKKPFASFPEPAEAVRRALMDPVGCKPLRELAEKARSACVLICDITRPVPNGMVLGPLLEELVRGGIPERDIRIVIATGLHRPNLGSELREVVGSDEVMRRFVVENHYARRDEEHTSLGTTAEGLPILMDHRFVEADLRIVIGLVEPHFMAGYSGGRKVAVPGVAHRETILRLHAASILEHDRAANCIMEGNPLHEIQMEIVRKIGTMFAVNVVLDEQRRMGFVNFGDLERSHEEAVGFLGRHAEISMPRPFSTVVTSSAGYPLDKTYYQVVKGLVGALNLLSPGGTVICAAECSEGLGSPEFVRAQELLLSMGPHRFLERLRKQEKAEIDEWATEMLLKVLRVGRAVLFSTGLSPRDAELTGVASTSSIPEAVLESVETNGDHRVAVIPEGPYVIPFVRTAVEGHP